MCRTAAGSPVLQIDGAGIRDREKEKSGSAHNRPCKKYLETGKTNLGWEVDHYIACMARTS